MTSSLCAGDSGDYDGLLELIGDAKRAVGWEAAEPPETYPSAL